MSSRSYTLSTNFSGSSGSSTNTGEYPSAALRTWAAEPASLNDQFNITGQNSRRSYIKKAGELAKWDDGFKKASGRQ